MVHFIAWPPHMQALASTLFTWGCTAAGAALVFFFKTINRRFLDGMLGFAAGVMIAASFWSLLQPSIALSEALGYTPWLWPLVGFLCGGFFLRLADMTLPHLHPNERGAVAEGFKTNWRKSLLMVMAITLHNIPEGFAVGVAFAAVGISGDASLSSAIALAIGIGIQNLPEGFAVAMPLRGEGMSRRKAFFWGQASGFVEPVAGVAGALLVEAVRPALPFALSFAAGAMIFVVVEDVIPESQSAGHNHAATMGAMLGFAVMMLLDVALG